MVTKKLRLFLYCAFSGARRDEHVITHSFKWSEYLCQYTVWLKQNHCTTRIYLYMHVCITCSAPFICSKDGVLSSPNDMAIKQKPMAYCYGRENMRSIHLSLRQRIFITWIHIYANIQPLRIHAKYTRE